jgi:hypothetical protein
LLGQPPCPRLFSTPRQHRVHTSLQCF